MNTKGTSEHSVTVGLPVYRLVGPNGEFGGLFGSATAAGDAARRIWPGVEQKDTEDGPGWDIETIGGPNLS